MRCQRSRTLALALAVATALAALTASAAATEKTASSTTAILGAAWRSDDQPIPQARLRLRNVLSGQIAATTVANELGQFVFKNVESGTYAVELVSDGGKLLTIGHRFTVAPGETVATFVRLGTKVPWFDGFFRNAASAIASSAASTGVTAVAPERVRPVSARQ